MGRLFLMSGEAWERGRASPILMEGGHSTIMMTRCALTGCRWKGAGTCRAWEFLKRYATDMMRRGGFRKNACRMGCVPCGIMTAGGSCQSWCMRMSGGSLTDTGMSMTLWETRLLSRKKGEGSGKRAGGMCMGMMP